MGQKVNPHGFRVGVNKNWNSKWFADKSNFADFLVEDNKVRNYVKKKLYAAGVASVVIERPAADKVKVIIATARPGMVIGRSGDGIDELKKSLIKLTGKTVEISIEEVRRSELDAQLTAESIAQALERRVSFRRAMKSAIQRTVKAGAKGIKVLVSGRLGGADHCQAYPFYPLWQAPSLLGKGQQRPQKSPACSLGLYRREPPGK